MYCYWYISIHFWIPVALTSSEEGFVRRCTVMKNKMEAASYTFIVLCGTSAAFIFPDLSVPLVWWGRRGVSLCCNLAEEISVQSELGGGSSNLDGGTVARKELDTFAWQANFKKNHGFSGHKVWSMLRITVVSNNWNVPAVQTRVAVMYQFIAVDNTTCVNQQNEKLSNMFQQQGNIIRPNRTKSLYIQCLCTLWDPI